MLATWKKQTKKNNKKLSDPISTEMCYSLCAVDQFVVQESLLSFFLFLNYKLLKNEEKTTTKKR